MKNRKNNVNRTARLLIAAMTALFATAALADRVPPGTEDQIRERLAPFGQLCRPGDPCTGGTGAAPAAAAPAMAAAGGARSGEAVYNQFCGTCHNIGVAGAPMLADAEAWQPRIAKGMDTLWDHTLNGINAMPAKGTCMNCSDDELRGALDYMVGQVP
ncbi:MAG: c-type cytochrome [Pseudomonadales bacterium]